MLVMIKGAGDLASGCAWRLHRCGVSVVMTEVPQPTAVRRTVAFSQAIYDGQTQVEGVPARRCEGPEEARRLLAQGIIPVLVDPHCLCRHPLSPDVLVDAILAKSNLGTAITDAPLVVALGPGFTAGVDCHCVVETMRGHTLGRVLWQGSALPNTGVPGNVGGYTTQRLLRTPCPGIFHPLCAIGDQVEAGQVVATVDGQPVIAEISGVIRGLLPEGLSVPPQMKAGDVDPRCRREHCFQISDKSLAIAGGVLEAVFTADNRLC